MSRVLVALAFLAGMVLSPSDGPDLLLDGCIIRFATATPTILESETHHCSPRVTDVSITAGGDLRIEHSSIAKVVSATAAIDETLAARGIIAGVRANLDTTEVTFYSTVLHTKVRPDSPAVVGGNSNIFLTWVSVP